RCESDFSPTSSRVPYERWPDRTTRSRFLQRTALRICRTGLRARQFRQIRLELEGPFGKLRCMRLLLYNIRYGIGMGAALHFPLPGVGYLIGNAANLER